MDCIFKMVSLTGNEVGSYTFIDHGQNCIDHTIVNDKS